jgi:arginyl-tRNA synthetase
MADFNEIVVNSAKSFEPSHLAKYLFDLCKLFASYYQEVPILRADAETKEARLALIISLKQVLANGLDLLGIEAPEKM